uniref:CDGSH iron-sulfur domain-containing protein 1-like n=1 Tax=Oncorhynchus gorbuscha TaxID=8017 RepID=UPI001EAF65F6|nr:CDGSH iron-sulfur domain-containing protein 1-like [Oncorhynchus gorbuscha]
MTSNNVSLSKAELVAAIGVTAGATAAGILLFQYLSKGTGVKPKVNLDLQKDDPKVVHAFDIEDLGDKAVYCRCWRSKKFPYCDGAHTKHNEETGDNVGPLIMKRKEA